MKYLIISLFFIWNITHAVDPVLQSISILPSNPTMALGKVFTQVQFTALAKFDDGHAEDYTNKLNWSLSSNTSASIANGLGSKGIAFLKAVGTVTVYAKNTAGALIASTTLKIVTDPCPIEKAAVTTPHLTVGIEKKAILDQYNASSVLYLIVNGAVSILNPALNIIDLQPYSEKYVKLCYSNKNASGQIQFSNTVEYASKNTTYMPDGTFIFSGINDTNKSINTYKNIYLRCSDGVFSYDVYWNSLAYRCSGENKYDTIRKVTKTMFLFVATNEIVDKFYMGACKNSAQKPGYCFCLGANTMLAHEKYLDSLIARNGAQTPVGKNLATVMNVGVKFSNENDYFGVTSASPLWKMQKIPMRVFGFDIEKDLPYKIGNTEGFFNIEIFNYALAMQNTQWASLSMKRQDAILAGKEAPQINAEAMIAALQQDPIAVNHVTKYSGLWPIDWLNAKCGGAMTLPDVLKATPINPLDALPIPIYPE